MNPVALVERIPLSLHVSEMLPGGSGPSAAPETLEVELYQVPSWEQPAIALSVGEPGNLGFACIDFTPDEAEACARRMLELVALARQQRGAAA